MVWDPRPGVGALAGETLPWRGQPIRRASAAPPKTMQRTHCRLESRLLAGGTKTTGGMLALNTSPQNWACMATHTHLPSLPPTIALSLKQVLTSACAAAAARVSSGAAKPPRRTQPPAEGLQAPRPMLLRASPQTPGWALSTAIDRPRGVRALRTGGRAQCLVAPPAQARSALSTCCAAASHCPTCMGQLRTGSKGRCP